MSATDTIVSALELNWRMVNRAVEDLDDAALVRQPEKECNSIAWLMWHMNRVVDSFIHSRLQSKPQLWSEDGWHDKFAMSDDESENGSGWTAERLAAWEAPPRDVLLGYAQAVQTQARDYLQSLGPSDLERTISSTSSGEKRTVSSSLGILVFDNIVHGGQIAYLRGLYKGMGWFV